MSSYSSVVLAALDEHVGRFHIWGGLKDSHLVAVVSHEGRDVPPSPCRREFPTEIIWSLSKLPNDFPKANLQCHLRGNTNRIVSRGTYLPNEIMADYMSKTSLLFLMSLQILSLKILSLADSIRGSPLNSFCSLLQIEFRALGIRAFSSGILSGRHTNTAATGVGIPETLTSCATIPAYSIFDKDPM